MSQLLIRHRLLKTFLDESLTIIVIEWTVLHLTTFSKPIISTCILIGQLVCFHSTMKHENEVSNMIGCLQVVRIYSSMNEIKVYIHASYIIFLFVKTKTNNKTCSPILYSLVKTSTKLVRILEQVKTIDCVSDFTYLLLNSPERSPRFSPGYEGMEKMLISYMKSLC